MLLEEAKNLYPNTVEIVNVRIDKYEQNKHTLIDFFTGYTETVTYTGNALAIRYTNTVTGAAAGNGANGLGGANSRGDSGGLFGFLPFF
jgi:hypothetical protein